jgi:hypothetical protein
MVEAAITVSTVESAGEALFQPCPWAASVALDPKVARSFISAAAD